MDVYLYIPTAAIAWWRKFLRYSWINICYGDDSGGTAVFLFWNLHRCTKLTIREIFTVLREIYVI